MELLFAHPWKTATSKRYADSFCRRAWYSGSSSVPRMSCRVTARLGGRRLDPSTETALFRVAQQALANVADHAGASSVEVLLERSARGEVLLRIVDDGCGFDPSHVQPAGPQLGFGLTSMRERAEAIGGRLTIRTAPGAGTTVEVRVP